MKKILAVFAHPDDEAFGPGGTLAKYGHMGTEIHLLCATRGEEGLWNEEHKATKKEEGKHLHHFREEELIESASVLKIKKVEFLDFHDGKLCNALYHELAEKISGKINSFEPDIVLTNERHGISGHLDHIAISMITTYAFIKTKKAKKLYYNCLSKKYRDKRLDDYFVYFPEGYEEKDITTRINYEKYWEIRKKAMLCHDSQKHDAHAIIKRLNELPKIDSFILHKYYGIKPKFPETDLFKGL